VSFAEQIRDLPAETGRPGPGGRRIDRPGWRQLVTPGRGGRYNAIEISGFDARIEARVDAAIAEYERLGCEFKIAVFPGDGAAALADHLESIGLSTWTARAMWCAADLAIEVPPGIAAREIAAADLDRFVEVAARAWEMDPAELDDHGALLADAAVHLTWASRGDEILGTAAAIDAGELVYLSGAAVLPEHRGRGAYRALIAGRLAGARRRGIDAAGTHAREATSAPILERLGFETLFRYRMFGSEAP
jgi:GNAT superfamily N-acetyltransferase